MTRILLILGALVVIAHPVLLSAVLAVVLAVLEVAAWLLTHPLVILPAVLAVLAVIATGIARSAGVTFPTSWRTT